MLAIIFTFTLVQKYACFDCLNINVMIHRSLCIPAVEASRTGVLRNCQKDAHSSESLIKTPNSSELHTEPNNHWSDPLPISTVFLIILQRRFWTEDVQTRGQPHSRHQVTQTFTGSVQSVDECSHGVCFMSSPGMNKSKVREAHRRIMVLNHPDKGKFQLWPSGWRQKDKKQMTESLCEPDTFFSSK